MSRRTHSPELAAIEVGGITRSAFLLRGALTAGAMYGAGAVGPFVSRALAQGDQREIEVVSFALALEELEAQFYTAALKSAKLSGEVKKLATEFGKHEREHAEVISQTIELLGAKPVPSDLKPKFNVTNEETFLRVAVQLEDAGVGAYNGAAPQLRTPDVVAAAGGIVQVEARHAAALRMKAGQDPAPEAFDRALSVAQTEAAVRRAAG